MVRKVLFDVKFDQIFCLMAAWKMVRLELHETVISEQWTNILSSVVDLDSYVSVDPEYRKAKSGLLLGRRSSNSSASRRLAVRQARVRFPARHPYVDPSSEQQQWRYWSGPQRLWFMCYKPYVSVDKNTKNQEERPSHFCFLNLWRH